MTEPKPRSPRAPARLTMRAKLRMIAVVIIGAALLFGLKSLADRDNAHIRAREIAAQKQRAALNAGIATTLARNYRGESTSPAQRGLVVRVGKAIVSKLDKKQPRPPITFHLLNEPTAINLFTLADGNIYVTTALVNRMQTEGQLAAVLAHGVAHVLAQHDMQKIEARPNGSTLPLWAYTLENEHAVDRRALALMAAAGYDPNAMIGMLTVQLTAYQAGAEVSYFLTHPNERDRLARLQDMIEDLYPQGVPASLSK